MKLSIRILFLTILCIALPTHGMRNLGKKIKLPKAKAFDSLNNLGKTVRQYTMPKNTTEQQFVKEGDALYREEEDASAIKSKIPVIKPPSHLTNPVMVMDFEGNPIEGDKYLKEIPMDTPEEKEVETDKTGITYSSSGEIEVTAPSKVETSTPPHVSKKSSPKEFGKGKRTYHTGKSPFGKTTGFAKTLFTRGYSTKPPITTRDYSSDNRQTSNNSPQSSSVWGAIKNFYNKWFTSKNTKLDQVARKNFVKPGEGRLKDRRQYSTIPIRNIDQQGKLGQRGYATQSEAEANEMRKGYIRTKLEHLEEDYLTLNKDIMNLFKSGALNRKKLAEIYPEGFFQKQLEEVTQKLESLYSVWITRFEQTDQKTFEVLKERYEKVKQKIIDGIGEMEEQMNEIRKDKSL